MNQDSAALRYAEALFAIGHDTGRVAEFRAEAAGFLSLLEASSDLRSVLTHPSVGRAARMSVLDGVLERSGYDPVFANFLRLMASRGRMSLYPRVVSALGEISDRADGIVRCVVYSAQPLDDGQRARLSVRLSDRLGCGVRLDERVDVSLIGGIKVEARGRVFDGSVRHHLEQIRENILNGGR